MTSIQKAIAIAALIGVILIVPAGLTVALHVGIMGGILLGVSIGWTCGIAIALISISPTK